MDTITRIAKNSVMVLLAKAVQISAGFVLISAIPRYLGASSFGDYAFIKTFVTFMMAFTYFGLQEILIREIAKDKVNAAKYLGGALLIRSLTSLIIISGALVINGIVETAPWVAWAINIAILGEIFLSYSMIFVSVFKAFEQMEYEFFFQFLASVLLLCLTLAVIYFNAGFIWLFVAAAMASFARALFSIYFCNRKIVRPTLRIDVALCKYLIKEGFFVGAAVFLLQAVFKIDVLILGLLKSPAEVAFFYAPHNLVLQIGMLAAAFTSALFPVLSRIAAENDFDKLIFTSEKILKIFLLFTLPLSMFCTIFGGEITVLIFGKDFLPAVISMQILIWTVSFLFAETFVHFALTSLNKQKYSAVSALCGFMTNLILDLIMIPYYGYVGACIATVFSYFLMCGISFYFLFRELGSLNIGRIIIKPITCTLFAGAAMLLIKKMDVGLITFGILTLFTYGFSLLLFRAFSAEDLAILKRVARR